MMRKSDLRDSLVAMLSTDATVESFCQAEFGTPLTVYDAVDAKDLPLSFPLAAISEGTETLSADSHDIFIGIELVIQSESKTISSNVIRYDGRSLVDRLAETVLNRILAELNPTRNITVLVQDEITEYPVFHSGLLVSWGEPVTNRTFPQYK